MSTGIGKNKQFQKIKEFWPQYESKIILIFAFILVAVLAFEAGILKGQKTQNSALIIEKTAECVNTPNNPQEGQKTQNLTTSEVSTKIGEKAPQSCQFVASKNSDKYHKATCGWAKRIKPENRICFGTEQEAIGKGLKQAGCCFK